MIEVDVYSKKRGKSLLFQPMGRPNPWTTLCQSSRMIVLSCGIKISAVHHLDLSQSMRVTDRRTDGRTDRITTPKTALVYARAVIINV